MLRRFLEWDYRASARLRLEKTRGLFHSLMVFFAHSGDSWFWLAGLFLIWMLDDGEWRIRATLMAVGLLLLAVVVLAIKFTIRRRRPEGEWGAIYRNTDPHSFPSGHAARAVFLAVMALGLGPVWFGLLLIIWAPLVALARVALGVHYLSDILAGMLLGLVAGLIMLAASPQLIQTIPLLF
ncbi:MAG: phosphatase PAP2 family protein [Anaerolineaceae bacterium]|nr:phosphatase PAP2 family protein [Anaerolineaceae bacterium]MBN2677521.1 phosphatase PAP2 family protein [Anaerolineaceae bacterium]